MTVAKQKASSKAKKAPVTLREKTLANGNKSLYLDIYRNGKREYEFLKLLYNNDILQRRERILKSVKDCG